MSVLGLVEPLVVLIATIGLAFFTSDSPVPSINEFVALPAMYVTFGAAGVIILVAPVMAITRRSLCPIGLALAALGGMVIGLIVSVVVLGEAEDYALEMVSDRSMSLVRAIENYRRRFGHPPGNLTELVPAFLPAVPTTGMDVFSDYTYAPESGACSEKNRWSLVISMPDFDIAYFVYCPLQDYDAMDLAEQFRVTRIGAWVYTTM
jgi:hypothetical protein